MCDFCHEFDFDKLEPCDKCKFIFTCKGKKHFNKNHHGKWCQQLKLYYELSVCEKPNLNFEKFLKTKSIINKKILIYSGCGVSIGKIGAQRRIVGGDEAGFGSFPWQAYIRIGSSRCGGSLVNRYHVVTAGHCVAR